MKSNRLMIVMCIAACMTLSYECLADRPGYVILSNGERIECELKYESVTGTPQRVNYRRTSSTGSESGGVSEVREFGVFGKSSFRSFKVQIDRSGTNGNNLSTTKEPEFREETLFLEVLVEGNAILYGYDDAGMRRYFIGRGQEIPVQLVYKEYVTYSPDGVKLVAANNTFKQQLKNELLCERIPAKWFEAASYSRPSLTRVVEMYNKCDEVTKEGLDNSKIGGSAYFSARAGASVSSIDMYTESGVRVLASFDPMLSLRFGLEAEFVPRWDKRRWSVSLEPTWLHLQGEMSTSRDNETVELNYEGLQVTIGVRRYFPIREDLKVFIECSYMVGFSGKNSKASFSPGDWVSVFYSIKGVGYGTGLMLLNRYQVAYRYFDNSIDFHGIWAGDLRMHTFMLGYRFGKLGH